MSVIQTPHLPFRFQPVEQFVADPLLRAEVARLKGRSIAIDHPSPPTGAVRVPQLKETPPRNCLSRGSWGEVASGVDVYLFFAFAHQSDTQPGVWDMQTNVDSKVQSLPSLAQREHGRSPSHRTWRVSRAATWFCECNSLTYLAPFADIARDNHLPSEVRGVSCAHCCLNARRSETLHHLYISGLSKTRPRL